MIDDKLIKQYHSRANGMERALTMKKVRWVEESRTKRTMTMMEVGSKDNTERR